MKRTPSQKPATRSVRIGKGANAQHLVIFGARSTPCPDFSDFSVICEVSQQYLLILTTHACHTK
ncbi:hypothetical protein [Nostoc sp.]|uniref:hypothetical protein n=1 Tax=Nostoc sp. TaxID=1180 RepID=UPI002FF9035A